VIARLAAGVSLRSRRRKFRLFMEHMRPTAETTIVDVGVADAPFAAGEGHAATYNFLEAMYAWPQQITAASVDALPRFAEAFPQVRTVQADGRDLPFSDDEFDLGFSNAVVEHLGDRDSQEAFVRELCRVSKRVFVTTPNRWFPVEVHTLIPFVHWLPPRARKAILGRLSRKDVEGLRPLGPAEFRSLFPYPVRLINTGLAVVAVGPESPGR
jgi:SAM-dependent methyltransferase